MPKEIIINVIDTKIDKTRKTKSKNILRIKIVEAGGKFNNGIQRFQVYNGDKLYQPFIQYNDNDDITLLIIKALEMIKSL